MRELIPTLFIFRPNGLTSTTLAGDSDHHPDNRDDLQRRALRNKPIQSKGLHLEKENRPLQANHSSTLSADSSQPLKPRTNTSSPKRFLSPRGVRFLQLSQPARQRVLAANPAFQAHRQAQLHQDPSWSKREQAFADALNDTQISLEQRQVLVEVFQGHSVFFTGSAGERVEANTSVDHLKSNHSAHQRHGSLFYRHG